MSALVLCDVNVLLFGLMAQSEHHQRCRRELDKLRAQGDQFAASELVLSAVVRIATNPKIFKPAPQTHEVFPYVNAWRTHPRAVLIQPGPRHWGLFEDLVTQANIRGGDVSDAYFAALAMEHGCVWWTTDDDFKRFAGLQTRHLLHDA